MSTAGEWNDDDYDVLADGVVVGRIFKANASPVGASWKWTLAFGQIFRNQAAKAKQQK
jgi:hypothetical protein